MMLKHKRETLGYAVVILSVMVAPPAMSKDFGILTRMLYAAFLAEQGAAVCAAANPAFSSETRGPMGGMHTYAEHIKTEVTAGLNQTETLSLLKSAADTAKAEALQAIRSLRTGSPETETAKFTRWCQTVVKTLVRQVIDTHDNQHDQIDHLIETALARRHT
ncbi:MAG: hypothetical protein ACREC0_09545 [Methylocella sp.]